MTIIAYTRIFLPFMGSISFLFLDDFEGNTNIISGFTVTIHCLELSSHKSGSTVLSTQLIFCISYRTGSVTNHLFSHLRSVIEKFFSPQLK